MIERELEVHNEEKKEVLAPETLARTVGNIGLGIMLCTVTDCESPVKNGIELGIATTVLYEVSSPAVNKITKSFKIK